MIGQVDLKQRIDNTELPHFIILVGDKGTGKRTLSKYVSNVLKSTFILCDIKVASVREVIENSYKVRDTMLYCFADADNMRNEAKNAMLKITEEPPKHSYFILTVQNESSLLDTIKSRGMVLRMQSYTANDIKQYCEYQGYELQKTATTPYEADILHQYGKDFVDYVELVLDNIVDVRSANAFKSGLKLALKNEDDKYDLTLFFSMFIQECVNRITEDIKYSYYILLTSKYLSDSKKLGVNKQQLYDKWVLQIRRLKF